MKAKPIDVATLTKLAASFTSTEKSRYYLCAVGFWLGPKGLDIMATDGHTLFHAHTGELTCAEPMAGMLEAAQAARGEEPDMVKGEEPTIDGGSRFPKWQPIVNTGHKQPAFPLDLAGWKDFDWAAKMAKVIAPESSLLPLKLLVEEGKFIAEAAERYSGDSMRHELLWPAPVKPWAEGWDPKCGIQAAFARRFAGAAVTLGDRASWTLSPPKDEFAMWVARGAWATGEATMIAMPVRL